MREIYHLTEENKDTFFVEIKVREVFTVPDSLMGEAHDLALKSGMIIEDYDPSSKNHMNVKSLYAIPYDAENVMLTLKMTEERLEACVQRCIEQYGLNEGDMVIYCNSSDYGWLNEKQHKILRIIPMENMQNSRSDCAEIQLDPPLIRKNHNNWKGCDYVKWNKEHNDRDPIGPDDVMSYKQISPIHKLKKPEVFYATEDEKWDAIVKDVFGDSDEHIDMVIEKIKEKYYPPKIK